MSNDDTLKQILSIVHKSADGQLQLHEEVGALTREVASAKAEHRATRAEVGELRQDVRALKARHREVRKRIDSVADDVEATGRHELEELREGRKHWARTVGGAVVAAAIGIVTTYLATKGH